MVNIPNLLGDPLEQIVQLLITHMAPVVSVAVGGFFAFYLIWEFVRFLKSQYLDPFAERQASKRDLKEAQFNVWKRDSERNFKALRASGMSETDCERLRVKNRREAVILRERMGLAFKRPLRRKRYKGW